MHADEEAYGFNLQIYAVLHEDIKKGLFYRGGEAKKIIALT
jgi:hypothetical protein